MSNWLYSVKNKIKSQRTKFQRSSKATGWSKGDSKSKVKSPVAGSSSACADAPNVEQLWNLFPACDAKGKAWSHDIKFTEAAKNLTEDEMKLLIEDIFKPLDFYAILFEKFAGEQD